MTSNDLQAHYRAELARTLRPEGARHVNPKTTAWMLKHAAATEGGTYTPETGARTWIWSDLHLHHKNIIRYCNRSFQSVEAMNEALLAAWKETVGEADTIICGGDIASGVDGTDDQAPLSHTPLRIKSFSTLSLRTCVVLACRGIFSLRTLSKSVSGTHPVATNSSRA